MKSGTGRNCFGLEENRSLNDCFVANGSLKNCDFNGETLFVYWKKKKNGLLVFKCWWLVRISPEEKCV